MVPPDKNDTKELISLKEKQRNGVKPIRSTENANHFNYLSTSLQLVV